MKHKRLIVLAILLLCVTCCFAQTAPVDTGAYKQSLQFLQGDGIYETGVMAFLTGLKDSIWTHFDLFITDAKALAAIFMIIFFSIKSYEMMIGDKKVEIMPLLRPFGLAMIILWWGTFVKVVEFPADIIANTTSQMFESEQRHVDDLRFQR